LGFDLGLLNFKMIGLALVIFYVPEILISSYFEDKTVAEQAILDKIISENIAITKEISKDSNLKSQLLAYNGEVERLKNRSAQVDEILKFRTNPKKILELIARSAPEDLWFDLLKITDKNAIIINGGAYSSRSIGEFITVINSSTFFANSITPTKQENKVEALDGVSTSYEAFELKGEIKNYDMRSK
jgi:Tfp pilus assembly protein PilN